MVFNSRWLLMGSAMLLWLLENVAAPICRILKKCTTFERYDKVISIFEISEQHRWDVSNTYLWVHAEKAVALMALQILHHWHANISTRFLILKWLNQPYMMSVSLLRNFIYLLNFNEHWLASAYVLVWTVKCATQIYALSYLIGNFSSYSHFLAIKKIMHCDPL